LAQNQKIRDPKSTYYIGGDGKKPSNAIVCSLKGRGKALVWHNRTRSDGSIKRTDLAGRAPLLILKMNKTFYFLNLDDD
jgi:hypothetical protein